MIKIISDSSCDRPQIPGLSLVPMMISTENNQVFRDDDALNITEMLDCLAALKGRSYTACPGVEGWLNAFEGNDEICVVTITSGLSGSFNSAVAARELYLQTHPEAKIHIFDSLSTGPEMALLLQKLYTLGKEDLPFEEICARATEYQKHTRLFFCLQSLHNLSQNGRVSKVVAKAAGVLNIRVVGTASPEGTLATLGKPRGDKKALKELIDQMEAAGYNGGKVLITHVENPELADSFAWQVAQTWPEAAITIAPSGGLCSYYGERGGLLIGIETK